MFLSKIWFILIALVAAVAGTFALVAPRPAVQKLAALEGQRLDRAQYAAEQMFKVDAHKWIDRVSKLGRDAILSESLDAASRGSGEYTVIHRTIQDRFRTLIPDLGDRWHRRDRRARQQGAGDRPGGRRRREGIRRLHRRRRGGGGRAPGLPLGRRLGRGRQARTGRRRAGAVEGQGSHRRRDLRRRRDRPGLRRAAQEEPRRRRRAASARQGDRQSRARPARWTRCPRWSRSTPRKSRTLKRTPRAAADRRARQAAGGGGPVPGSGGRAAGLLRAHRRAAGQDRPRGAALQRQLQRSQVGQLPLGAARRW